MDELAQKVEQWYHIPSIAGTIFTLVGVHFLGLKTLIVGALVVDFCFSKYIVNLLKGRRRDRRVALPAGIVADCSLRRPKVKEEEK